MWKKTWKLIKRIMTEENGGTIIETAVIVPVIWMIIMGSIFLLFFFFDMGVLRSQTIRIAREAALDRRNPEAHSVGEYNKSLREGIGSRLILAHIENTSVNVAFGKITAVAGIVFRLGEKGLTFSTKAKAAVDHREDWVRILSAEDDSPGE